MSMLKMEDLNLNGKRVLIRSDLNVPIKNGKIISDFRILSSMPTIIKAIEKNAKVIIMSHLGRPKEGQYNENFSLKPIADFFQEKFVKLVKKVVLVKDYLNGINYDKDCLTILENVRFNNGEKENNNQLSEKYAKLCDIFVMDAFGILHRSEASSHGLAKFAPISCAGPLLMKELQCLSKIINNPNRPMVSVIGGSKISTKLTLLKILSNISDKIIVGGGIANTLIAAMGFNIGKSIFEKDLICESKKLLKIKNIILPKKVCVANELSDEVITCTRNIKNIKDHDKILDIYHSSSSELNILLKNAKTILWNGPIGAFEYSKFQNGTKNLIKSIINSSAFSVVGGGDTISAIEMFSDINKFSYVSTGGGSFLKFIEDKNNIPIISILENRSKE